MLDFRPTNPNRPPDWRWQLGKHLAESSVRLFHLKTDRYVGLGKKFALRLIDCQSESQHLELLDFHQDLYEAWRLYNDTQVSSSRWCVEARLLADQTDEQIAERGAMTPETVMLYEKLFFNVRPKLDRPDYIAHNVFTEAAHRGLDSRKYDLLWKMFGYFAGPNVLDFLIYKFNKTQKPDNNPTNITAYLADDIRSQQILKTAIAVRTMPINWQTQIEVLNIYYRMLEMERQNDSGGPGGQESFNASIKTFLANVPWASGMTSKGGNLIVAQADLQAQSLRAAELLTIAEGQMPPGLEALLASAKFPEEKTALPLLAGPAQEGKDAIPST